MFSLFCEHYIVSGLCDNWSIAAPGSETIVKIGYEYGCSVTGEEQQIELNLDEEPFHTDSDQVVPNPQEERSMELVITIASPKRNS